MLQFFILLLVALGASALGFKKYVWFISIGYGLAVAAIAITLLIMFNGSIDGGLILMCILLIIYGGRLAGYLAYRELRVHSYNKKMVGEIKDGKDISIGVKCAIWGTAALLYVCQTSPVLFNLQNGIGTNGGVVVGIILAIIGISLEIVADFQKNAAKRNNPHRFVDTGLFRIVRCPNYLGELFLWTGLFVVGIGAGMNAPQWVACICGYAGIIYVMFSGARRLEERQNRSYGDDPEYRKYAKTVPIMIPFVPLYSVEKYKWLVG